MTDAATESKNNDELSNFINAGWKFHTEGNDQVAEQQFDKALAIDPESIEAYYGLGIVMKNQGNVSAMVTNFEKVIQLVDHIEDDRAKAEMLRRLAMGHINQARNGDWGLEGEIWKHSS
jgi:Tfp pilus assembly protein PilF